MPNASIASHPQRFCAALAALALAGCSGLPAFAKGPVEPRFAPGAPSRLGPGDLLRVEVWEEKEITREVALGPDGRATIPLLGPTPLAGRTIEEATAEIATHLKRYVREPAVTVALMESRSVRFEVLGEVYEPGSYRWFAGDTVVSALERASGFVPATAAFWRVHLVRGALDRPKVWKVNLEKILDAQAEDVAIEPGDVIYVPPRWVASFDRFVAQALGPVAAAFGVAADVDDVSRGPEVLFSNGGFLDDRLLVPVGPGSAISLPQSPPGPIAPPLPPPLAPPLPRPAGP